MDYLSSWYWLLLLSHVCQSSYHFTAIELWQCFNKYSECRSPPKWCIQEGGGDGYGIMRGSACNILGHASRALNFLVTFAKIPLPGFIHNTYTIIHSHCHWKLLSIYNVVIVVKPVRSHGDDDSDGGRWVGGKHTFSTSNICIADEKESERKRSQTKWNGTSLEWNDF